MSHNSDNPIKGKILSCMSKIGMILVVALLVTTMASCVHGNELTPSISSPVGWCCLDGEVFHASEPECIEMGGRFFLTPEEAEEFCRGAVAAQGWCCLNSEVFPSSEIGCLDKRGRFFLTQEEAEEFCRGTVSAQGWCCLEGEIFRASEAECIEMGGRLFPTPEEAEESCYGIPGQPSITDLKGPRWGEYVSREVTVEGIFVRDPLPMLVTNLDIVLTNMDMPLEQYILLIGNISEEINPREYGGSKLRLKGVVNVVDDISKYGDEHVAIETISYEMLERLEPYSPEIKHVEIQPTIQQPHKYAVLFSGGINPAKNHTRYWNDLKFMYSTLINKCGFPTGNIAVLYADGKALDKEMPVHYSATQANLETVFTLLKGVTTIQDLIFMFTTNHGGGFNEAEWYPIAGGKLDVDGDEGAEPIFEKNYGAVGIDFNGNGVASDQISWDEELYSWGGSILDDDFEAIFVNLQYDKMIIVMEQCFSGGLIPDMTRSTMARPGPNKIIISAAGEYEPSHGMDKKPYDEFSYYFTLALGGVDPDGNPVVDADFNNDGMVSIVEMYNYATWREKQDETPWYEDNGDGIPHPGEMPAGGDGTLGSNTFLRP